MGTDGWPTLPRTGVRFSSRPSFSSARMMTETVCADSPVIRAISAFAKGPTCRISERTNLSLCARTPLWLDPRTLSGDMTMPCLLHEYRDWSLYGLWAKGADCRHHSDWKPRCQ